jgi:hypothetical protein
VRRLLAEAARGSAFVQELEHQLLGLVAAASGDQREKAAQSERAQAGAPPRTERDSRAWDSLQGLAVADALGARYEGRDLDEARERARLEPTQGLADWTDDTQMAL